MQEFKSISSAMGNRIHAIADRDGIDADLIATRFTCERLIDEANWHAAFGVAPYMLKGGLLIDNGTRPTTDADIQSVRQYTEDELLKGMRVMKDRLRENGIDVLDASVRYIDVGHGDPISRLQFHAKTGGVAVKSQVDISTGFGRDAFPADVHRETFPSFATKSFQFPTYTARRQPLESQLAEKWIAIATQSPTDLRMKHHADIVLLQSQDFDLKRVGEEIIRTLRHRGLSPEVFSYGMHNAIQRVEVLKRADEWEKSRKQRPSMASFEVDQVLGAIASAYRGGVYNSFIKARDAAQLSDFRRLRAERMWREQQLP